MVVSMLEIWPDIVRMNSWCISLHIKTVLELLMLVKAGPFYCHLA
jgi:hypothetical protein